MQSCRVHTQAREVTQRRITRERVERGRVGCPWLIKKLPFRIVGIESERLR